MKEFSGAQWCARFPTSRSLDDLVEPFRSCARGFIGAVQAAGAAVTIGATYRPAERAYLMHYACLIAGYRDKADIFHQISPQDVPPMAGVDIDWTHGGDVGAARSAAVAMVKGYAIAYPATLDSRHIDRRAIDMTIRWKGIIQVRDARGVVHAIGTQEQLWPIGSSYGVRKLVSDPPHWSNDGH